MTVICDWYSQTAAIIGMSYIGNWTREEADAASLILRQLTQSIDGRYDIIVDSTAAAYTLPSGTLWHWKQSIETVDRLYPNQKLMVYVMSSSVYKAYFDEGFKTSDAIRKHCRLANSISEAVQIIQQDRLDSKD